MNTVCSYHLSLHGGRQSEILLRVVDRIIDIATINYYDIYGPRSRVKIIPVVQSRKKSSRPCGA